MGYSLFNGYAGAVYVFIRRQVSTPSLGVGYKIALMIHQRCKPCLCLLKKNKDGDGDSAAIAELSPMLTGDKNLDVSTVNLLLVQFQLFCHVASQIL